MKDLSEQDHYEILEIPRCAAIEEVERAYRLTMATYSDDSLAGYSIFGSGDVEVLRNRIEEAFHVLSDDEKRAAYDATLSDGGDAEPVRGEGVLEPEDAAGVVDAFEEFDDQSGEWNGARLRRARLRRGIELERIASATKINPLYLRFLEEERFDDLPAAVYVRGFVCGYASNVGLDANRIARSYMSRFHQKRGSR